MIYNKRMLNELELSEKVVFLRLDLNVPVEDGKITSFKRINSTLPTIKYLLDKNAKIVILSHFGRPKTIQDIESGKFSLEIVARSLASKIGNYVQEFTFISESKGTVVEDKIKSLKPKSILFLENTRFNDIGIDGDLINLESGCNEHLAKYWASLCDVFVNDAYGAAHRKHASTYGIAAYQPNNAIGFLMNEELKQLTKIVNNPIRPLAVIFGGAKVSDKSKAVESTLKIADKVIISGGMAYTFLAAQGYDMGLSNVETNFIPEAKRLLEEYPNKLVISSDFLCSPKFENIEPIYRTKTQGLDGLMGLDIGEKSVQEFENVINECNSILWNGPMGVTEFSHYTNGTNQICDAIAKRTELGALTVIGGGDSAAAAEKLGKQNSFSWISTGGGASLVLIEGKELEGIASIADSVKKKILINKDRIILNYSKVRNEEVVDMASSFDSVFEEIFGYSLNEETIAFEDIPQQPETIETIEENNIFEQEPEIVEEDNWEEEFQDLSIYVPNYQEPDQEFESTEIKQEPNITKLEEKCFESSTYDQEQESSPIVGEQDIDLNSNISPINVEMQVFETTVERSEPKHSIENIDLLNVVIVKRKPLSNSAKKLRNLINIQKMNLEKLNAAEEE